ncbi:hypothetical protein NE237_025465 [Protea cynaroides]|uniref:Uncharacterized protein n=1 Tax=Protea cynaroides TaxID=273540 RepID=A0A9Q0JZJ2_9MAGN|nr:hypothetical protein NE237_025465 [Protea cynaroides]
MAALKPKMKLLVDKEAQKVLFAEADKEVVDILLNLLTLPVATIVKLLQTDSMVGSLCNLYNSIENLSEAFVISFQNKISLLEPKLPVCVGQIHHLLLNKTSTAPVKQNHTYATQDCWTLCPKCNILMSTNMAYVAKTNEELSEVGGGYVYAFVRYMVMDDLSVSVASSSTISGIAMLNQFNVREVGSLEEKCVDLGVDECLAILKASLQSKTVLTDVFLGKKPKLPAKEIGVEKGVHHHAVSELPSSASVRWCRRRGSEGEASKSLSQTRNQNPSVLRRNLPMAKLATPKLRMKLLVDKKAQKVLFAVSDKKVVDFLFNLLSLPLATVVKLLMINDSMVRTGIAEEKASSDGRGYVKGLVTYMVMDDLFVTPMSSISVISLLNRFNVRELVLLKRRFLIGIL